MKLVNKLLAAAALVATASTANAGFLENFVEKPGDTLKREIIDKVPIDIPISGTQPSSPGLSPCGGTPRACNGDQPHN